MDLKVVAVLLCLSAFTISSSEGKTGLHFCINFFFVFVCVCVAENRIVGHK